MPYKLISHSTACYWRWPCRPYVITIALKKGGHTVEMLESAMEISYISAGKLKPLCICIGY